MPDPDLRERNVQRPWAAILAATLLNLPMGSLYAFSVFLKPLEQSMGVTRAELAAVFAMATVSFTLGMNIAPRIFRLAPAPVLVAACAALSACGVAISAELRTLVGLAAGYGALFGIGGGAAYILLQQGVNLMLRSRKGLVNGYIVALYPAGAMLAAPLFGWAVEAWGVHATLGGLAAVVAATGAAATALTVLAGTRLTVAGDAAATGGPEGAPRTGRAVFWQLWTVFFLAAAAGLTVLSQAAGMIVAYGGSAGAALFATTGIAGAIAGARFAGGWLVDRFAIPRVMAAAHAMGLLGAAALALWPGPAVSVVALAMVGMGYGLISGSTAGAIAFYWPGAEYGRVASRLYIAWCFAAVSLPVVAGRLYDLSGGYGLAMLIAGACSMLGIALATAMPRAPARP